MAIARVQDAGAVSNEVAYPGDNTAGNLLVAVVQHSSAITSLTDTAGNTWVEAHNEFVSGDANGVSIWHAPDCLGGANTVTAANGFGTSFTHIWVGEYSGIATATPLDQTAGANDTTGLSSAPDSGATGTTAEADELLVGGVANDGSRTMAWTEPDTEQYDDATSGAGRSLSVADEIVGATGTYSAVGTLSGVAHWFAAVATFKAAAGGGGSVLPLVACDMDNIRDMGGMRG